MAGNSNCITMLPQIINGVTTLHVIIEVQAAAFSLWMSAPFYPSCRGLTMNTSWNVKQLLGEKLADFQSMHRETDDISCFLRRLTSLLEECVFKRGDPSTAADLHFENSSSILLGIDSLGWDNVHHVDENFTSLTLRKQDEEARDHYLTIDLTDVQNPQIVTDLPEPFDVPLTLTKNRCEIEPVFREFCCRIEKYQKFWQIMDELDGRAWVLEPEKPSRKDTRRKITISSNAFALVTVNPSYPELLPDIQWIGSESAIEPLRNKLALNINNWDQSVGITGNLEYLLDIELPTRPFTSSDSSEVACGICYATRLEDEYPSHSCDNERCGQTYHLRCLYDWLHGLSTAKVLRNLVFGDCPYCSTPIHCKQPD